MTWYVVVQANSGEAISFGTVLPARMPEGLRAILLSGEPDLAVEQWDAALAALVARPPDPAEMTCSGVCPLCGLTCGKQR